MENQGQSYRQQRLYNYTGIGVDERTYNLTIGLTLLWGAVINILMAVFLQPVILRMNYLLIIVLYFAGTLGCSAIVHRSQSPAVSFVGFSGMAFSMGLLLTYYVYFFTAGSVLYAFLATGLVTIIMIILSMLYPAFFQGLGRTLFIALIGCIISEVVLGLIFRANIGFIDYIVALVFCGYIGYDWNRAQQFPKTVDNAVDCAADIYLDCVNLFVRILSITGKRRN